MDDWTTWNALTVECDGGNVGHPPYDVARPSITMPDPVSLLTVVTAIAWSCYQQIDLASATHKGAKRLAKEVKQLHAMLEAIKSEHPDEAVLEDALGVSM